MNRDKQWIGTTSIHLHHLEFSDGRWKIDGGTDEPIRILVDSNQKHSAIKESVLGEMGFVSNEAHFSIFQFWPWRITFQVVSDESIPDVTVPPVPNDILEKYREKCHKYGVLQADCVFRNNAQQQQSRILPVDAVLGTDEWTQHDMDIESWDGMLCNDFGYKITPELGGILKIYK